MARRDDCRCHCNQFGTPHLAQDLQRVQHTGDAVDCLPNGFALAVHALVVQAGSSPDPRSDLATAQCGSDRRGSSGVADAHLAQHQQIGIQLFDGSAACLGRLLEPIDRHC